MLQGDYWYNCAVNRDPDYWYECTVNRDPDHWYECTVNRDPDHWSLIWMYYECASTHLWIYKFCVLCFNCVCL